MWKHFELICETRLTYTSIYIWYMASFGVRYTPYYAEYCCTNWIELSGRSCFIVNRSQLWYRKIRNFSIYENHGLATALLTTTRHTDLTYSQTHRPHTWPRARTVLSSDWFLSISIDRDTFQHHQHHHHHHYHQHHHCTASFVINSIDYIVLISLRALYIYIYNWIMLTALDVYTLSGLETIDWNCACTQRKSVVGKGRERERNSA